MIGGEEYPCGIRDQQKQFEADRPLHRIVKIAGPVVVRDDAAAVRLGLEDDPFLRACLSARIELSQHVRRDRHDGAESI